MYWDVTEVKPEPDYCLFVRFKDGMSRPIQLQLRNLTGVFAPLRNLEFFNQVFIDQGAVAWPGKIDLAPDASVPPGCQPATSTAKQSLTEPLN